MKPTLSLNHNSFAGKAPDHQPCKFGGKELDAMYGLHFHDFHARLQIPDLGRFDRPDPLADKYPHLSPYLFCANDPVNNTDPTGMEIVTFDENNEKYWYRQLEDKTFGFVNSQGNLYNGNSINIEELTNDLLTLQQGAVGSTLVNRIVNNESELTIFFPKDDNNKFIEKENVLIWNIDSFDSGLSIQNGEYSSSVPSYVILGHELAHVDDYFSGNMNYNTWVNSLETGEIRYSELRACRVENYIRTEHGIPLRTHYSRSATNSPIESTRLRPPLGISLYNGKFSKEIISLIFK